MSSNSKVSCRITRCALHLLDPARALTDRFAPKQANPKSRIAQKILAAEATELIHGGKIAYSVETIFLELQSDQHLLTAEGLNQALAATSVFYGTDLADLVTPEVITALDGAASSSTKHKTAIPSMLTGLPREAVVGQHLEKAVLASGLVSSKSASLRPCGASVISPRQADLLRNLCSPSSEGNRGRDHPS